MTLCEIPSFSSGASWSTDNTIVFAGDTGDGTRGLFRVPAGGGAPEALTTPDAANEELGHIAPEVLPNGKAVLFSIRRTRGIEPDRIAALSLESGE